MLALQTVFRIAGIAALALSSGAIRAQAGGSILMESDYRFRGVSLSGESPTAHLTLSYDHPSGWYGGASLTGVEVEPGPRRAAATVYGGLTRRDAAGETWELGTSLNHFFDATAYDYGEVYAGFIAERWTARVYLSPDYFGRGVSTAYGELNGALPLTAKLRTFAHVGVLARLAGSGAAGIDQTRYDARVGLGLRVAGVDVQLAWVGTSQGVPYVGSYQQRRNTVVLSASYNF